MTKKKTADQPNLIEETDKGKSRLTTDQWFKLGGLILALVGTTITVLKFTTDDSPEKLSENQKKIYIEVSDVIGALISSDSIVDNDTASEFYRLYNGRMILVEDSVVSRAMRRFKFELDDKRNGLQNVLNPNKFQKTGIEVIEACRNALDEN